ncbi:MAG: uracil-DNA glycosylase [Bacteroidota bacterium]|jgi:uracil-DNA glycosylase
MSNLKVKLADSLNNDWKKVLNSSLTSPYFSELCSFLSLEYGQKDIFPPIHQVFSAFYRCSFQQTKVVIIGQDPYHGEGQAQGLSFSVPQNFPLPPSLKNIYKELYADLKVIRYSGDLSSWADQGVLLLNSVLTVRSGEPGSHAKRGWEQFSEEVIIQLSQQKESIVFVLWGAYAQKLAKQIDAQKHFIIQAAHPSPLSANRGGFFGTKPFSKINEYLVQSGQEGIDWARE